MAAGGRAQKRAQMLRMGYVAAAVLIVLALLFAIGGNWVWTIIFAILAAVAVWFVRQARAVR
jgi:hypothetical protein